MMPILLPRGNRLGRRLAEGLVAYYRGDEAAGAAAVDRAGNGLDLTDTNTVGTTAGPSGRLPLARQYTAASLQFHTRADPALLEPLTGSFTIGVFGYYDSAPVPPTSGHTLVSKYNVTGNQRGYVLLWEEAAGVNKVKFVVSNDGSVTTTVTDEALGTPSTATWYCHLVWYDAAAQTINIQTNNGTVTSAAHSTGVFDSTAPFQIGGASSLANYFMDGRICAIGWWNRVLIPAERDYFYNRGAGRIYQRGKGFF